MAEIKCPKGCTPVRIGVGLTHSTAMYFQPILDEHGNNTNPDRNHHTTPYDCKICGHEWVEES